MKKYLKTVVCTVMTVIMLLAFTGCGGDQKAFVGEWVAEVDVTELTSKEFSEEEELKDFFKFEDLTVNLVFAFNEDGTYSAKVDKDSVDKYIDSLTDSLTVGMEAYLKDLCLSLGVDITDGDTLKGILSNMGVDSIAQLVEASIDRDELADMFDDIEDEGKYKASNGKLYTYEDGTVPDTDVYEEYEIVSDTEIKVISAVGTDEDEEFDLYPLTLKKQ